MVGRIRPASSTGRPSFDDEADLREVLGPLSESGEEWATIERGSVYAVSTHGRVYSFPLRNMLRPGRNTGGHYQVAVALAGRRRMMLVHRLVALAFIPNPYPTRDRLVRHLDDIKSHNDVTNLAWGTDQDNASDWARNRSSAGLSLNQD